MVFTNYFICFVVVVREQLLRAQGKSLEDVLRMEFRLAIRIHARADLKEGVRARLVDKGELF